MMEFLKKAIFNFKNLAELTRGYTLPMTFASCMVIYCYAVLLTKEKLSLTVFAIMVFALCCVHLCANLFDDYRDVKKQLDQGKTLEEITFTGFIPKAALILNKTFSIKTVRIIIGILSVFAISFGICFYFCMGWPVLFFMIIGGLLILFYPISSKYGCQELVVGLGFGPLMIMGGCYALTATFEPRLFVLSIAIFFTTVTLLHTKNIMDWEFDIQAGKKTLAILSGSKENAIKVLTVIVAIPYMIVLAGVLFNSTFNPNMLFVFFTLPIATKLISSMKDYIAVKDVEFKPRWYWGFFENWKAIKEKNLAFFMFRFYLARNYAFFFALLASIGALTA